MSAISQEFDDAVAALEKAKADYATAESNLIRAERAKDSAWRAYCSERFPTKEALQEYFRDEAPSLSIKDGGAAT